MVQQTRTAVEQAAWRTKQQVTSEKYEWVMAEKVWKARKLKPEFAISADTKHLRASEKHVNAARRYLSIAHDLI